MDTLQSSYPVGQAPWETQGAQTSGTPQSFPVGQAPWEQQAQPTQPAEQPQVGSAGQSLMQGGITNPDALYKADPNGYLKYVVSLYAPTPNAGNFAQILGNEITTGVSNLQQIGQQRGKAMAQPISDYLAGKDTFFPSATSTGALGKTAEQLISQTAGGIGDVFGEVVKRGGSLIANTLGIKPQVKQQINGFMNYLGQSTIAPGISNMTYGDAIQQIVQKSQEYAAVHPEFAKHAETVTNLLNAYLSVTGLEEGATAVGKTLPKVGEAIAGSKVGQAVSSGLDTLGNTITSATSKSSEKVLQDTIQSLNPELSGKKLTAAYSKNFGAGAKEAGLLKGQAAPISEQTTKLGTNLQDLKLSPKDSFGNLQKLGQAMQDTGSKLDTLLAADKTPVIKQGVSDALDENLKTMPREFIKDPNKSYQDVIDFAKQTVNKSEPNINGLRDAVTEFDNAARKEYPSAYKPGGYIDTKTPAGQAIKDARDTIRQYMYNTAEKGSELQKLIRRESDLYRARDLVAPQAAKGEGLNKVQQFFKAHPKATKAIKAGVLVGGGYEVAKHNLLP